MARRRGNAPRQPRALDFAQQSEARQNFALSAKRATASGSGNTGEGALAGAYRKARATKTRGGLNFARRKRGEARSATNSLGQKQAPKDAPQRPMVSDRQYQMNPAMTR